MKSWFLYVADTDAETPRPATADEMKLFWLDGYFVSPFYPSSPEPSPSNPDVTAAEPVANGTATGDGDSPQGSETGSGTRGV